MAKQMRIPSRGEESPLKPSHQQPGLCSADTETNRYISINKHRYNQRRVITVVDCPLDKNDLYDSLTRIYGKIDYIHPYTFNSADKEINCSLSCFVILFHEEENAVQAIKSQYFKFKEVIVNILKYKPKNKLKAYLEKEKFMQTSFRPSSHKIVAQQTIESRLAASSTTNEGLWWLKPTSKAFRKVNKFYELEKELHHQQNLRFRVKTFEPSPRAPKECCIHSLSQLS